MLGKVIFILKIITVIKKTNYYKIYIISNNFLLLKMEKKKNCLNFWS